MRSKKSRLGNNKNTVRMKKFRDEWLEKSCSDRKELEDVVSRINR